MITSVSVGELRRIVESANEMKPVMFGQDETKRINDKAYSDVKKKVKTYDGGLASRKKGNVENSFYTDNKGMHDLEFDNISDDYKERVKAQMKGYPSKDAYDRHKNDEFGNADFDNDELIYKAAKEHAKKSKKGRDVASEIGLTGRELAKKDVEDLTDTMYESKKIKCLNFKKVKFLNENHVLASVPDEYKRNGNKFVMKDKAMNEYLVEWNDGDVNVTKKPNMNTVNEEKEKMKHLWGYKSSDAFKGTNAQMRVNEGKEVLDMINKARKLMENN